MTVLNVCKMNDEFLRFTRFNPWMSTDDSHTSTDNPGSSTDNS